MPEIFIHYKKLCVTVIKIYTNLQKLAAACISMDSFKKTKN